MRPLGILAVSVACSAAVAGGVAYGVASRHAGVRDDPPVANERWRSELGELRSEVARLLTLAGRHGSSGEKSTAFGMSPAPTRPLVPPTVADPAQREAMPRTAAELRTIVRDVVDEWHKRPASPAMPPRKSRKTVHELAEELNLSLKQIDALRDAYEKQGREFNEMVFGTRDPTRAKAVARAAKEDPSKAGEIFQRMVGNVGRLMVLLAARHKAEASILEPEQLTRFRRYEVAGPEAELEDFMKTLLESMGCQWTSRPMPHQLKRESEWLQDAES